MGQSASILLLAVILVVVHSQLYNCTQEGIYPSDFTQKCTLDFGNHKCNKSTHCKDNATTNYTYCTLAKQCLITTHEMTVQCSSRGYSELDDNTDKPAHTQLNETCKTTSIGSGNSKTKVCRTHSVKGRMQTECETGQ